MSTDRIEKHVDIAAPVARVWRAVSDAREFGEWFGMALDGPFESGAPVGGAVKMPNGDIVTFVMQVVEVVPERLFSFTWHPYAVDPDYDYSQEAQTLVEFRFAADAEGGATRVTVTESGFDRLPAQRREEAFVRNSAGWDAQVRNLANHVAS